MNTAFTLIEILIVLGLLFVLSLIGTVYLRGATERAKYGRVVGELKTLEIGIEGYRVDSNSYPRMAHFDFYGDSHFDMIEGSPVNGLMSSVLSSPVSYVANAHLKDVYATANQIDEQYYTYQVIDVYVYNKKESQFWPLALDFYGGWRLGSVGPDGSFNHGFINSGQLPYDPTNGSRSLGNIWISAKNPQQMPAIPSMLGVH